ncbi:VanZ family protein [Ruminiclostridium herbifermentans]|uniref:VanZ family protein n=1 Tax=Ruminiclostridium herbifermentans TaxID=2488810 RepID=A0A4V6EMU2_9FIRM|nr:VanZ family protein [Ruminiclostridium herbifermentans]QNU66540.1 VanZ family protein [Ruminiclostridium herbifermentans]
MIIMDYQIQLSTLLKIISMVIVGFIVYFFIKVLLQKRFKIEILNTIFEYCFILIIVIILKITGIIFGNFGVTSIFAGNVNFSFNLFEEGLTRATVLNLILFIPFGFSAALAIKKLREKWFYGLLLGMIFSIIIEFLQSFTGRYVQIDDVIMNTIGSFIGYEMSCFILLFIDKTIKHGNTRLKKIL